MVQNKRTVEPVGNTNRVLVITVCPFHNGPNPPIEVDRQAWNMLESGHGRIADLFPELSVDEREMLQSGVCTPCWDDLFDGMDEN